jgi:hypothetical protein
MHIHTSALCFRAALVDGGPNAVHARLLKTHVVPIRVGVRVSIILEIIDEGVGATNFARHPPIIHGSPFRQTDAELGFAHRANAAVVGSCVLCTVSAPGLGEVIWFALNPVVLNPFPVIFEDSLVVAAAFLRAVLLRCARLEVRVFRTFVTGIFPALRCLFAGGNAPFGERGRKEG